MADRMTMRESVRLEVATTYKMSNQDAITAQDMIRARVRELGLKVDEATWLFKDRFIACRTMRVEDRLEEGR